MEAEVNVSSTKAMAYQCLGIERAFAVKLAEYYMMSLAAASGTDFLCLGLADSNTLELRKQGTVFLSVHPDLCLEAQSGRL